MKIAVISDVHGNHDSSLFFEDEMTLEEKLWIETLPLSRIVEVGGVKFLMFHPGSLGLSYDENMSFCIIDIDNWGNSAKFIKIKV